MASSGKFDLSSGSPDRLLYTSGQRGSYTSASMENPILSSLPSMSRSTSNVTQGDVTSFLQCLRFDPKAIVVDHKFNRYGEFKRLASAAVGALDDLPPPASLKGKRPSSSPEELKRLKAGLRESAIKARDRVKIFSDSLSVVNKCFPSIPSRKRSRPDRSNGLLVDRSVNGAVVGKMSTQIHALTSALDFEQQKVEERPKSAIPNKRTRTSMVDQRAEVRPNTPARSSGDKEILRLPSSNSLLSDDRALPIIADGWEKAKMKKKRSGIKADAAPSPSSVSTKPVDGYREPKQGLHPKHLPDARSRSIDSNGIGPGAAHGVYGTGKADGTSQRASMSIRSENMSLLFEKRDRTCSSEKEKTNLRAANKANVREEFISGSPTSSTKQFATARGPRSGSGVVPKLPPVVQRATASGDWELPRKNPGGVGSGNRKRTLSARSSSPPVAQWADRRPPKMSRTARRTNLVPIVSTGDEVPPLDTGDVTASENGHGIARRFPANSPQQLKSKGDRHLSSTLSESEESGPAEIRSRDRGKKSDEVEEEKAGPNVQKLLPTRKNKLVNGEHLVDGIRKQGRTGRGFVTARSGTTSTGKLRNVGTAKQLRTARLGFDKSESKIGRPPTRKLSDRRAYTRQKLTAVNVTTDFLDDGHEELLAAANTVLDTSDALSSPFWGHMEPLFVSLSDIDIAYIKQQRSAQSATITNPLDTDTLSNGHKATESSKSGMENGNSELSPEHFVPGEIPLCQRLLAALISEEGDDEPTYTGNDDLKSNVYASEFEFETDVVSNAFERGGRGTYGDFRMNSARISSDSAICNGLDHSYNGSGSDPAITPSVSCSEYQYGNMSINERLLLEIQSIGLYPQLLPDLAHTGDEDIDSDISKLEEMHREQVSRKNSLLGKLLKSTDEAKELQEKEFEQRSLDKLTEMAYHKYLSCRGPSAPGGKSASGKMAKQAALAFVKRTLDRCKEFEATGKSCFAEPLFREMFLSRSSHFNDALTDGEPYKLHGNSTCTQHSPSLNNHENCPSDEQTIGKGDVWSSRVKKRELYLDDVSGTSSGIVNTAKGKRSERDAVSRNGAPKVGRPASSNVKKTKTKPKPKTTQVSASANGPVGRASFPPRTTLSSVPEVKENDDCKPPENLEEPLDFSHLQLPGMEDLGVGDGFGEQGQDLGSWLNIDDDVLQDEDFMGLEIPMDDLSDLNMMV